MRQQDRHLIPLWRRIGIWPTSVGTSFCGFSRRYHLQRGMKFVLICFGMSTSLSVVAALLADPIISHTDSSLIVSKVISSRTAETLRGPAITGTSTLPPGPTYSHPIESNGSFAAIRKLDAFLLGVNLSGGEYNLNNDEYGRDYIYPDNIIIGYYAGKGMKVIRLPFLWERVQTALNGPLSLTELAHIDIVVKSANSEGVKVILDPHDFGQWRGSDIGSPAVPTSSFVDFWSKMARHYKGMPNVIFGLMNEPYRQSGQQWATIAEAAIMAIRQTGAPQQILVPGCNFDSGWIWDLGGNSQALAVTISDPFHNISFEVHQYLDGDASGTHFSPITEPNSGAHRLAAVTSWARRNRNKLFLGEFGVPSDQQSLLALSNMLTYLKQNSDVWEGGTYWAGGAWWGQYPMSIEPAGHPGAYIDKPQMAILQGALKTD